MRAQELAKWLREHHDSILVKWIRRVRKASPGTDALLSTQELSGRHLSDLYNALTYALETGETARLDSLINQLVKDRLQRQYSLEEVLIISQELKNTIWEELSKQYSSMQTLEYLKVAEELFDHIVTHMANAFTKQSLELIQRLNRSLEQKVQERTRELQRAKEELERIDKAKSDFIRIAAHELRTPLTLVQGYVGMLLSGEGTLDRERIQPILQGLVKGVRRLETIVRDLIDASYIDAEVLTLNIQKTSLARVINLAINEFKPALASRNLKLSIQNLDELPSIEGDPQRLYQVFYNLISNAIKYTPDGGKITISGKVLDSEFVQITVSDTGIGIPPDKLERIFDKFYRLDEFSFHSTSKTAFKGAGPGLGLTIARGIVEAHGGRIWAESPGYDEKRLPGSSFHVLLPIKTPPGRQKYIHRLQSPIKAVIFDLDGVMVDTAQYHFQAWQRALSEFGYTMTQEQFQATFGMRNPEIIRTILGPDVDPELVEQIGERKETIYRELIHKNISPMPGLLQLIQDLKGRRFRIAVATSTPKANAHLILKALELEHELTALITEEDVKHGKPDPEIFLLAAERCQAEPQNCVVVEDAPAGIQAAKAAGMKAIAITTTHPREELKDADLIIDNLGELDAVVIEKLVSERG